MSVHSTQFTNYWNSLTSTFNYQIWHLQSICESRGKFSGRSALRANYSEFPPIFRMFHEWGTIFCIFVPRMKIQWGFPADFVRLHSDKEMISRYFLLVGLFEQWETNLSKQNPEKRISKKWCNEWNKYLIPCQSERFPGVFYTCKELRLGALL